MSDTYNDKELRDEVSTCIEHEYTRASHIYGRANHSPHESYAVILEEFDEATENSECFKESLARLWKLTRRNENTEYTLYQMQCIAEQAASEWVQVAAMCYKARVKEDNI